MTYRIGGEVTDQGNPVSGQPVFVVDTGDADPSNWAIVATTTTDSDGGWSVVVPNGDPERYHAVTQFEDSGTLKNAESKPFVTAHPELQAVAFDIQIEIPTPKRIGTTIPDSGVSRWEFEQDVTDSWGNNDGTDNTSAGYVSGTIGSFAKDFDGNDDNVTVGDNATLDFGSGDFSIAIWAKTSTDKKQILVSKGGQQTGYLLGDLGRGTTLIEFNIDNGSSSTFAGSEVDYDDGNWHLHVGVRDSGELRYYFDGSKKDTTTESIGSIDNGYPFVFGYRSDNNSRYWDGPQDDCRVYSKGLSDTEVSNLYNNGSI